MGDPVPPWVRGAGTGDRLFDTVEVSGSSPLGPTILEQIRMMYEILDLRRLRGVRAIGIRFVAHQHHR